MSATAFPVLFATSGTILRVRSDQMVRIQSDNTFSIRLGCGLLVLRAVALLYRPGAGVIDGSAGFMEIVGDCVIGQSVAQNIRRHS